ncbi:MAG TPA: acyltransferase [Parafilimonas sp.]|nr:acyltransferase [Parafilimonas sp.]
MNIFYLKKINFRKNGLVGKSVYFQLKPGAKMSCGVKPIIHDYAEIIIAGKLNIGNYFTLNKFSRIVAYDDIVIGDYVTIAQFVSILDHDHAFSFEEKEMKLSGYTTAAVRVGNNVWIGDKVTILKGVTIGNNVIIAANSVVNKNVPDNCIVAGVPFKIIKQLE